MEFNIKKKIPNKLGRAGILKTAHGDIQTPAFVPVATKATIKSLTPEQVKDLGAQVVLSNTYHLYLEPGDEVVRDAGGVGKYMNWEGPTMTDSGGFQVFSLGAAFNRKVGKISKHEELMLPETHAIDEDLELKPRKAIIDPDGVTFRSHIDGSAHYFTPEKSIDIQHNLGADIIFAFDECTAPDESEHYQAEALDRTHRWAKRSLDHHRKNSNQSALFGIVQGGRSERLRKESAKIISEMRSNLVVNLASSERSEGSMPNSTTGFDGFGIGGSFEKEDMMTAVKWCNEILPPDKPRHLLGIGEPADLFGAVENGCDLFDCVAPTRIGRNGTLYTKSGKINITNSEYRSDFSAIESDCGCYTCAHYTKSYLCHLFRGKEMLAATLASIHNLYFIIHTVDNMRQSIYDGNFLDYKKDFLEKYRN